MYHQLQLKSGNLILFQLPRKSQYNFGVKEVKIILQLAAVILNELQEAQEAEKADMGEFAFT